MLALVLHLSEDIKNVLVQNVLGIGSKLVIIQGSVHIHTVFLYSLKIYITWIQLNTSLAHSFRGIIICFVSRLATLNKQWKFPQFQKRPDNYIMFFFSMLPINASLAPPVYVLPLNFFSLLYSVWNSLICLCLLRQDHAGPTREQRAFPRAPPTNQRPEGVPQSDYV